MLSVWVYNHWCSVRTPCQMKNQCHHSSRGIIQYHKCKWFEQCHRNINMVVQSRPVRQPKDLMGNIPRLSQKRSLCCIQCEESASVAGTAAHMTEMSRDAAQSCGLKVVSEHCSAHLTNSWASRSHNTGQTTPKQKRTGCILINPRRSLVAFN